jgi:hypothetical protein
VRVLQPLQRAAQIVADPLLLGPGLAVATASCRDAPSSLPRDGAALQTKSQEEPNP